MSRYSQILYLCLQASLIFLFLLPVQGTAFQIAPLPDQATASYHPGLFLNASAERVPVSPMANTSEGEGNGFSQSSGALHFSFFPGDTESCGNAIVAGYISGRSESALVNISGRADKTEQFRYLTTVKSDNQGIFVWSLPEWASNITTVRVETVG